MARVFELVPSATEFNLVINTPVSYEAGGMSAILLLIICKALSTVATDLPQGSYLPGMRAQKGKIQEVFGIERDHSRDRSPELAPVCESTGRGRRRTEVVSILRAKVRIKGESLSTRYKSMITRPPPPLWREADLIETSPRG